MKTALGRAWFKFRAVLMLINIAVSLMIFTPTMVLAGFILPLNLRSRWTNNYIRYFIGSMRVLVNVRISFEGMEHIPEGPYILYSKHNSTLETFIIQGKFPRVRWIVKKEAFYIPFFGWGLASLSPIWIDRSDGNNAVEQILKKGGRKLAAGQAISIFPEGTRVPVGQKKTFKSGGGILAEATDAPLLCMTHNCGCFWPAKTLLFSRPGTITFRVRPLVETGGRTAREITRDGREWIEQETEVLYRQVGC